MITDAKAIGVILVILVTIIWWVGTHENKEEAKA